MVKDASGTLVSCEWEDAFFTILDRVRHSLVSSVCLGFSHWYPFDPVALLLLMLDSSLRYEIMNGFYQVSVHGLEEP